MAGVRHRVPLPSTAVDDSAEQLYEHAPCGYLSTALDGTIVRVNQTLLDWLGHERADVVGRRRFADLLGVGPRVVWQTHHVQQLAATGQVTGVTLDLQRADGTRLPVLIGAVMADPGGDRPRIIRMTVFDATERRAYEAGLVAAREAAERSERRARALQRIAEACSSATSEQELLPSVTAATTAALDACGCAVWLGRLDADRLERAAVLDLDDSHAPQRIPLDARTPFTAAWTSHDVVVAETPGPAVHDVDAETALAIPLRYGDAQLGVLGVYLRRTRSVDPDELAVLRTIGGQIGQALARTRMHAELQRLALHDALTGLPNRTVLADRTAQTLARTSRDEQSFALLVLDLDGFKPVNDTLGHAAGDALLRAVADRLVTAVRSGDTVTRLGGDEFAVLCADADEPVAAAVAGRIRQALAAPFDLAGSAVTLSASVGIALCGREQPVPTFEALLADADAAMYLAKRSGKDRHAVHREAGSQP